jgi:hypothetical protein
MLFAIGNDAARKHGTDARERIELLRGGDIDIDGKRRPSACRRHVRHAPKRRRVAAGHRVRGEPVSPRALLDLALRLLSYLAARRVDGGELAIERASAGVGDLFDGSDGAQRTDGCPEDGDAGQEEERLLFGGGRHAESLTAALQKVVPNLSAGD